jgi:glycosyltransferase involved in cell wall biosynthesis
MKKNIKKASNNNYIYLIILLVVIVVLFYLFNKYFSKINPEDIPDVKWPFINLKDEKGKNINMLCVRGHMTKDEKKKFLEYYKKGIKFLGCSSYLSYPRLCDNKHGFCHKEEDIKINGKYIEDYVLGWCHCFREPEKYIRGNKPRILISESDFNNERLKPNKKDIKYDYLMYQPKDSKNCDVSGWHSHNKNWSLADRVIKVLSDDMNLKGIVTGREGCKSNIKNKDNIEISKFIKHSDFMDKIRESRFVVIPNLEDASPRLLTEAMCLDKPILVNEDILGGWKYVNDKTGTFFNKNNIQEKATWIMNNSNNFTPRKFYIDNYGDVNTGKRLKEFLKKIYPDLSHCEYVKFPIS